MGVPEARRAERRGTGYSLPGRCPNGPLTVLLNHRISDHPPPALLVIAYDKIANQSQPVPPPWIDGTHIDSTILDNIDSVEIAIDPVEQAGGRAEPAQGGTQ